MLVSLLGTNRIVQIQEQQGDRPLCIAAKTEIMPKSLRVYSTALELLYLVHRVVVCGYTRVVDSAEPDHHWVSNATLQGQKSNEYRML